MFGQEQRDRANQAFADRFQLEGSHYLFRKNLQAAGIQISRSERDRFVADFAKQYRVLFWTLMAAAVAVTVAIFAETMMEIEVAGWLWALVGAALMAGYAVAVLWVWNAPSRALAGRATVGAGRSKAEARSLAMARLTWGKLGIAAVGLAIAVLRLAMSQNLLAGWNRLWLVLFGALAILIVVQAVRKLRQQWLDTTSSGDRPH